MSPPTTQITLTYPTDTNACVRLLRVDDGNLAQQTAYGGANNATTYL